MEMLHRSCLKISQIFHCEEFNCPQLSCCNLKFTPWQGWKRCLWSASSTSWVPASYWNRPVMWETLAPSQSPCNLRVLTSLPFSFPRCQPVSWTEEFPTYLQLSSFLLKDVSLRNLLHVWSYLAAWWLRI